MLSSVAKLADKNFIIGFFLPALLAVIALTSLFPCPPTMGKICAALAADNPLADLTYLALTVWVFAVILLSLNYHAYRVFEGYAWPVSRMESLKKRNLAEYKRLTAEYDKLKAAGDATKASDALRKLLASYPRDEAKILPTRFGNAIRAFEIYPTDVYGGDAISLWVRLAAVIPKAYQALLNDARAQVDFLLNVAILGPVVSVCAAARLITEWTVDRSGVFPPDFMQLVVAFAVGLLIGFILYLWAVERVSSWGNLVMSAFDLYLPTLAKQLGYCLPAPESERRKFWTDVSRLALYRRVLIDRKWKPVPDCACDPPHAAGDAAGKDAASGDGAHVDDAPEAEPEKAEGPK